MPTEITLSLHASFRWQTTSSTTDDASGTVKPLSTNEGCLLLRVLELMDAPSRTHDDEQDARWQGTHARIELGLAMLGRLLQPIEQPPEARPWLISGSMAQWACTQPPAWGELGVLVWYPQPRLGMPVGLPARIVAVDVGPNAQVTAAFCFADDGLQEWLDRTLFRLDRRRISQRRRHDGGEHALA